MAGAIILRDDFIIGGQANSLVTPNFRLSEFTQADGSIYIHRELAASLQVLRDNLGLPIRIEPITPTYLNRIGSYGLGIIATADDLDRMQLEANRLIRQGYLKICQRNTANIYLEIPDPSNLPAIAPKTAFECGVKVTAAFETRGDPYQQVTGNFDGAGLSFGPIQCNLGSGTLQELFRRIRGEDELRLQSCFATVEDYLTFWNILDGPRNQAVQWADMLSTGVRRQGFAQPWRGYLQAVGEEPIFRDVMLRYAYDKYGKLLMSALAFLQGVSPIKITNLRCLAALYDMGIQQGSLAKAYASIRRRITSEQPADEFALTRITVEERANKASPQWRADCLSRRLCILERQPVTVTMSGQQACRSNPRSYLLRNSPVKGLERYLSG